MRSTHRRFTHALGALVFTCLWTATLRADQPTGTIRIGIAATVSGAVLVDVFAEGNQARHWNASVDAVHPATMGGLPPGVYRVGVRWPGGETATLLLNLAAAELVQVLVPALSPPGTPGTLVIVDRQPDGHVTGFGPSDFRLLPISGSVDSLVETAAPFVVVDAIDSGGLEVARSRVLGNRGASGRENAVRLGDIELLSRPGTGVAALVPEVNGLEAVVVSDGLARPDLETPGASITLVPRRPGYRFAGALGASFTGPGWVWSNDTPTAPAVEALRAWKHVDVEAGLPLTERGGLFASTSVTRARKEEGGLTGETPINVTSTFAHFTGNVAKRDQVRVLAAIQSLGHEFDGRAQFADRHATERDRVAHAQTVWEHQRDDGSRAEVDVAVQHGAFTPDVLAALSGTIDRLQDGPMPPAAAASTAGRLDARLLFEPRERRLPAGSHAVQFGLLVSRSTSAAHIVAAPPVAELAGGLPARVWVRTVPGTDSSRHINAASAYVADRWAPSRTVTVDLGLRVGGSSGSAGTEGSRASWSALLPRAAFRWAPSVFSVFGGYSRYQPALTLNPLAFGDPGEVAVQLYRWNDINSNHRLDPGETSSVLVARAGRGPDVASIDPALRAPRTDELTIGIERQVSRTSFLRGVVTIRKEQDIMRSVNVGVPASAYVAIPVADQGEDYLSTTDDRLLTVYDRLPSSFGQDRFVLMNTDERGSYGGIELTYTLKTTRWSSTFGAMAYRTKGSGGNRGFRSTENDQGVLGEYLENPNAAPYSQGRLFFDRSYVGKWTTAYQAPHDLSIAVVARYQDGQPFTRFIVAPTLAQGPEYVAAYRAGRTRFTFTATADLRIEQGFRVGGRRVSVRLDVFNLGNDANEVEENALTGDAFRQSTFLQPPRTARLGLRFEW